MTNADPRFEPAPIGYMRGLGYGITDADEPFLRMIGYTREDLDGGRISWQELTPPEFLHLDEAGMKQATESGGFTAPYQKEFFRKDGSRVKVLLVCAFVPGGKEGEWVGYVVDLSASPRGGATPEDFARPLTEPLPLEMTARLVNELVRERVRMITMLDNTPAQIWAVDRRMRLLGWNQTFQDAQKAVSGKTVDVGAELLSDMYPEEFTRPWKAWYARGLAGERFNAIFDVVIDGSMRHFEYQFSPIVGAGGEVVGVTAVSADLTDRVRAEKQLEASDARFRSLAASLPVGVYLADADGQLSYVNPRFAQILDATEAELLGTGYLARLPPAARDLLATTWRETAASGLPSELPILFRARDGAMRHLRWKAERAVHAETGATFVGTVEDETARLTVAEQTRQREKMESLGTLAGGIAHDFNNMLGVILGFSDVVTEGASAAEKDEAIAGIRTASLRARELVQRILAFGRRTERAMSTHDLVALVEESVKLLRAAVPASIELVVELPPGPVPVRGEASALQQVLVNLCANAVHALRGVPSPRIHVRLSVREAPEPDAPHGTAWLVVSDSGHGIPPALVGRVFEPFFTTKDAGEGTGMGLAVVHGIVTSHGGRIAVTSTPGEGATFTVELPVARAEAEAPPVSSLRAQTRGGRVLLVDDEDAVAMVVVRGLARVGFEVVTCASAAEALACLESDARGFDVLLTDLTMPGMRGDELVQIVARRWPALPCVVMSGFDDASPSEDDAPIGARRGFLQKPFTMAELVAAVAPFSEQPGARRA